MTLHYEVVSTTFKCDNNIWGCDATSTLAAKLDRFVVAYFKKKNIPLFLNIFFKRFSFFVTKFRRKKKLDFENNLKNTANRNCLFRAAYFEKHFD